MEIVKEPHLEQLRDAVSELKRIVDGEPNIQTVGQAWRTFEKVKEALASLSPNQPGLSLHL